MILLGILALLQISFIPGFLLLRILKLSEGYLATVLLSFGLSLSINYYIVFILTASHIYNRWSLFAIVIFEVVLLILSTKRETYQKLIAKNKIPFSWINPRKSLAIISFLSRQPILLLFSQVIAISAVIYLIYYYMYVDLAPKTVFSAWDAVISWNRWALDWYHNSLPFHTWEYPQLLPANVSLTYVFINNSVVQLFAKSMFYIFPIAMVACLWDLGNQRKDEGYFWAILFLVIFTIVIFSGLGVSGFADIPVACMVLLAVYPLLLANSTTLRDSHAKKIIVGSIICGAATITKQAGIYLAVVYPILIYLSLNMNSSIKKTDYFKVILTSVLMILFYLVPWYTYKLIQIHMGIDNSAAIPLLQGYAYSSIAHPTLYQKLDIAISVLLLSYFNKHFLYLVSLLFIVGSLINRVGRSLSLLLVIPMFLMWAIYFSYDPRNIAFIIPFLSIILGFGLAYLLSLFVRLEKIALILTKTFIFIPSKNMVYFFLERCYLSAAIVFFVMLSTGLYFINKTYSSQRILSHQDYFQRQIGNPKLDSLLYAYFRNNPLQGKILTNYPLAYYLPMLGEHCIGESFVSVNGLHDSVKKYRFSYLLILQLDSTNKDISTTEVVKYIKSHEKTSFTKIFDEGGYLFYKVN